MEETEKISKRLPNQELDYFKIAKILISRWYWIVASISVCMLVAYAYLWYTPKNYATSATMKFEEKKSEISDLVSVINADKGPSRVQSETYVIQSRSLILDAIKDLDYRISFYVGGRIRTSDLYPEKPLNIQLLKFDSTNYFHDLISFQPVNNNSFRLSYKEAGKTVKKVLNYNTPVSVGPTAFSIKKPAYILNKVVYLFKFNTPEDYMSRVKGGLRTSEVSKNSNIISLQQTDYNPQFAADVLNAIMMEYLNYDRNQKTLSATQMIHFIQNQLDTLSAEVRGSAIKIKENKENSKVIDVTTSTQSALNGAKDLETQISLLKIQEIAIDQLKKQITSEADNININFKMEGVIDPLLGALIETLDGLLLKKSDMLKQFNANSQPVQDVNQQILQLKNAALNNINESRIRIEKSISYLNDKLNQVNQQIALLPEAEREMVSLKRDFEVNDKVYAFLSEKKLEAQISRSAILPGATIIEQAQPNYSPVSPNESGIHRTAIILGILLGLGLIILIRVLNPYIYDKETIESLTTIPILGIIRKFPDDMDSDNKQILAISKPKSVFAESVRSVRTNLSFLASEKTSKVICVTSEVAGEGKSFVAINLSSTLSLIDKKVILIAADLRRSKIHKTFDVPNDKGLSNYLANQCTIDEVILHSKQENLDFMVSGSVPPNPSELLHSPRMAALIAELKTRYDIIMIDTAPIGLVSDAIPLIRASDVNAFVIRSGKSKYYAATIPQRIAHEYHLENTVIILNAFAEDLLHSRYYTTKFTGENYGSRYYYYSDYLGYESSGYYVDSDKAKWWDIRRWFKKQ
ncbi:capsular exopolysaccharide family [Mucilaginibacter mallensis]|uniref:non-specific protein-tyrosine kinase n=1 Tax=Mucilaginibacter mallensis TaxID=652787 RepID=A0A1H2B4A0_MUCMA|nr:tyrosine-protein kinase family protein [Mucilaginibacter mallensis]SDT52912.1 capsular exopolysaccharide family [Mucilaginibacter mallensis]